jgi:hypothetical protein
MDDGAAVAIDTWYYVWLIRDPTNDVNDVLFSTSATLGGVTLPTNYTLGRRIGQIVTDGAGVIIGFSQWGDEFRWTDPPPDVVGAAITNTATLITLDYVPLVRVEAILTVAVHQAVEGGYAVVYVSPPDVNDEVPFSNANAPAGPPYNAPFANVYSQSITPVTVLLDIVVNGYIDRRGRDD